MPDSRDKVSPEPPDVDAHEIETPSSIIGDLDAYHLPTDLTPFQTHLLCSIYQYSPITGVKIQDGMEELSPKDINHGRYPSLDRMVDSGLISKQTKESDQRSKEYTLAGRGEWVSEEYLRFISDIIDPDTE